ncbi:unnamed protein product, partial [Notodromas monacha]
MLFSNSKLTCLPFAAIFMLIAHDIITSATYIREDLGIRNANETSTPSSVLRSFSAIFPKMFPQPGLILNPHALLQSVTPKINKTANSSENHQPLRASSEDEPTFENFFGNNDEDEHPDFPDTDYFLREQAPEENSEEQPPEAEQESPESDQEEPPPEGEEEEPPPSEEEDPPPSEEEPPPAEEEPPPENNPPEYDPGPTGEPDPTGPTDNNNNLSTPEPPNIPPSRPGPPYYPPRFPSDHPNRKRNQQQRRRTTTPAPTPLPPPPTQPPPPKVWTTRPPVIVPVWQPQHQPLPVTPHQNAYRPFSYQNTNAWAPVKPTEASYPYNQHHQQELQNPTGWQQQQPSYPNNRNFGGAAGGFVKPLDFGKFIQKMGVSMTSPEFRPPSSNHNPHHPEYHVPQYLPQKHTSTAMYNPGVGQQPWQYPAAAGSAFVSRKIEIVGPKLTMESMPNVISDCESSGAGLTMENSADESCREITSRNNPYSNVVTEIPILRRHPRDISRFHANHPGGGFSKPFNFPAFISEKMKIDDEIDPEKAEVSSGHKKESQVFYLPDAKSSPNPRQTTRQRPSMRQRSSPVKPRTDFSHFFKDSNGPKFPVNFNHGFGNSLEPLKHFPDFEKQSKPNMNNPIHQVKQPAYASRPPSWLTHQKQPKPQLPAEAPPKQEIIYVPSSRPKSNQPFPNNNYNHAARPITTTTSRPRTTTTTRRRRPTTRKPATTTETATTYKPEVVEDIPVNSKERPGCGNSSRSLEAITYLPALTDREWIEELFCVLDLLNAQHVVLVSNTTASRTDPVIIISRRRRRSAPTSTQASQNEPPPEDLPWLTCFLCETEDGDFAEDCEYGRDEDDDDFGTDASFITPSRANRTTGSGTHRKPEHEYYDPREFNDDDVKFDDADFAFDDAYEAIAKSTRPEEPKSEEEEEPEVTTEAAQQNTEQPDEAKEEPANSESRYQTVVEAPTQIFGVVSARNPKPDGNFRKNSSAEETFPEGSESKSSDFEAGTKLSPMPTVFTEQDPMIDPKETPGKQGRVRIMKRKLTPKNLPKTASTLLETQQEIKLPSDDSLCWQRIEMQLNSGHIRRKRTLCSDKKQVPKGSVPQKLQKMRVSEPPLKQFSRSRRNSGDENLHVKIKFRKNDPQRGLHVKTYEYKKGKSVVHSSSEFPRSNRRHQVKKDDDDSDSRREEPSSIRRNPHRGPLTSFIPAGYIKRSDASPTTLHHGNASTRERVPEIPAEEPSKEGPEEDEEDEFQGEVWDMVQEFKRQEKAKAKAAKQKSAERAQLLQQAQEMEEIRSEIRRQLELKEQRQRAKEDALRREIEKEFMRQRGVDKLVTDSHSSSSSEPRSSSTSTELSQNVHSNHESHSDLDRQKLRLILEKFPEYVHALILILQAVGKTAQFSQELGKINPETWDERLLPIIQQASQTKPTLQQSHLRNRDSEVRQADFQSKSELPRMQRLEIIQPKKEEEEEEQMYGILKAVQ